MVVLRAPGLELRGESLGQTRVVIPGNGDVFLTLLTCRRHWSDMLRLILQGENLDSGLRLDPVTATLECLSLSEGVAVEEPRRPCGVMK